MRVLIILTSAGTTADGKAKTGFSFAAFAEVYYALADAGVEVALASPQGGAPPHEPTRGDDPPALIRFKRDREARSVLMDTLRLDQIEPDDFDAAIYPGGSGTMLDLPGDAHSKAILQALGRNGKPVGVIGDGVSALFSGPLVTSPDASGAAFVADHIRKLIAAADTAL
ncbi:hypothetical protein sos41_06610 [Alphaproteobacteria bacterium SO-S41]|nr:hypothetical protein sos41_06610 [Alphaproteobacteria bacterium SO-S41]